MTERLTISFAPAEGAVLRMLGLVERRGYALRSVSMTENGNGGFAGGRCRAARREPRKSASLPSSSAALSTSIPSPSANAGSIE